MNCNFCIQLYFSILCLWRLSHVQLIQSLKIPIHTTVKPVLMSRQENHHCQDFTKHSCFIDSYSVTSTQRPTLCWAITSIQKLTETILPSPEQYYNPNNNQKSLLPRGCCTVNTTDQLVKSISYPINVSSLCRIPIYIHT
jgi:hypothetical protein